MLNRRGTPAAPVARIARNRWSDLESAPSDDWKPELSSTVVSVEPSDLERARAVAAGSAADVLVFAGPGVDVDDATVARLSWWQHVCDYTVSVAAAGDGGADDWLAAYQRDSEQLNRAGYEAFRGAAAGALAVRRELVESAGGVDVTTGGGWQLELAYRLAQRGAVFVLAPDARVPRHEAPTDTSALFDVIPLLPERRRDWRRTHRVATIHVVIDCATAPAAAEATIAGVLDGEYQDVSVSVVGWGGGSAPWDDTRVRLCDTAPASFPTPFRLELPAGCVLQPFSVRRLLNRMRESQLGLYQALVEPNTDAAGRSLAVRLLRTAAIERARRLGASRDLDDVIDELFGSMWVDGQRFGIRHHGDVEGAENRDPDHDADDADVAVEDEADDDD